MSTSHEFRLNIWLSILLFGTLTLGAAAQENIGADGILLHGKTVVLFAYISNCAPEGAIPAAQIFVSPDSGKSWEKRGPRLDGSRFRFVLDDGIALQVAGSHTAEGPELDPFILVADADLLEWKLRTIYRGPSELRSVARSDNGELSAWVKHINVHQDPGEGPTWSYKSADNGITWRPVGRVMRDTKVPPGRVFSTIGKQDRGWRIVTTDEGGFEVQEQKGNLGWKTVRTFPLRQCRNQ